MSSIIEIDKIKSKCQKLTPDTLVETMLNLAEYTTGLMGKTILENSFGSGSILKEIVVRYIRDALKSGYDLQTISQGLSHDIYGIELDKELYDKCLIELDRIVNSFEIPVVKWNLFNEDALGLNLDIQFDYIVGNPPFISYNEMNDDSRKRLQENYETCSTGKFDYCYAFIELGINYLNSTGKLVQLIPNNIFKNVFAQKLRDKLKPHISTIYDYPNQKFFDKTSTSVSLFLYEENNYSETVEYKNQTSGKENLINRDSLNGKWTFSDLNSKDGKTIRFGDIFHASAAVATLCNQAFLVSQDVILEEEIESGVLYKAASPKTLKHQQKKQIVFPYKYTESGLGRYSAVEFENLFPNTTMHLKKFKNELKSRNSDANAAWFEYGRSQALTHLNTEKLLLSTVITKAVEVYKIDEKTVPFAGIYITIKDNNYSLDDAISILKSEQFLKYVCTIGVNVSGKSLRITCKDINEYCFVGGQ